MEINKINNENCLKIKQKIKQSMTTKKLIKVYYPNIAEIIPMREMLIKYAKAKCAEQRELCKLSYQKADWVEQNECELSIINAPEPKFT